MKGTQGMKIQRPPAPTKNKEFDRPPVDKMISPGKTRTGSQKIVRK